MNFRTVLPLLTAALISAPLAAQLRPLDPIRWAVLEPGHTLGAELGVGVLRGQRASLAGTEGTLIEAGTFAVAWRTGRVALEATGTLHRSFNDREVFAPPVAGTRAPDGSRRRDSGDYRVSTTVRLTPTRSPVAAALRFGSRLPTTDNRVGLERDETDFFATVGGRYAAAWGSAAAETGLGIFGTSVRGTAEQDDVLLYAFSLRGNAGWLTPSLEWLGHRNTRADLVFRGNEDLSELRLGLRAGQRLWVQITGIRGLTTFSPDDGLMVSAGVTR